MNRETKRMLQRQGQLEADGSPSPRRPAPQTGGRPPGAGGRSAAGIGASGRGGRSQAQGQRPGILARFLEFLREIRSEWRQVAWPTRPEIFNSSLVVLVVLIGLVCLIFGLNWLFSHGFIDLFNK